MVKLSSESNWCHMHLELSRTLHAFEIGETCHTLLCDLVNMCIGEIWWFGESYEFDDLCDWWIMWICVEMCTWWCLLCLYTWWFQLIIVILVIVMECESYVYDLVISLVTMIFLPILLKWWIVFDELIRQEFMWTIWLMLIRWIIYIIWSMRFM